MENDSMYTECRRTHTPHELNQYTFKDSDGKQRKFIMNYII